MVAILTRLAANGGAARHTIGEWRRLAIRCYVALFEDSEVSSAVTLLFDTIEDGDVVEANGHHAH